MKWWSWSSFFIGVAIPLLIWILKVLFKTTIEEHIKHLYKRKANTDEFKHEADQELLKKFLVMLDSASPSMLYLSAPTSTLNSAVLDELTIFHENWNRPELHFNNRGLDKRRQVLWQAVGCFLDTQKNHFFSDDGVLFHIPNEWRVGEGKRYREVMQSLYEQADKIIKAYNSLIETAKKKAGF